MFQGIKDGFSYAIRGIRLFMSHRELWKYSIIPVLLLLLVYILMFALGFFIAGELADAVREWCRESLPSWLQWLYNLGSTLIYLSIMLLSLLIVVVTASSAYEIAGGPFLDAMVEKFECTHLGLQPVKKTFAFNISFALSMTGHGLNTLLLTLFTVILTLFFPYITLLLSIIILGYRFGIAYLAIAGYCRGMSLRATKRWAEQHSPQVRGYGMMIFVLLFFVPYFAPVILPGFILGGSLLLHEHNTERRDGI